MFFSGVQLYTMLSAMFPMSPQLLLFIIWYFNDKLKIYDREQSFKDLKFIDYSQLKPTNCDWADIDKKMSETNGHSIPQ